MKKLKLNKKCLSCSNLAEIIYPDENGRRKGKKEHICILSYENINKGSPLCKYDVKSFKKLGDYYEKRKS